MSIATEIARLQSAKAAIVAAIEGKRGYVPSGTLLSGLAERIGYLQVLPTGISGAETGEFTPSSAVASMTISHTLSGYPKGAVCWTNDMNSSSTSVANSIILCAYHRVPAYNALFGFKHVSYFNSSKAATHSSSTFTLSASPINGDNVVFSGSSTGYKFAAGKTYDWMVWI